jgi:hypothetical protein
MKLLGIISVDFDIRDQLLIDFLHFSATREKNESMIVEYMSYL